MAETLEGVSVLGVADNAICREWLASALRERGALVHACTSSAGDLAGWIGGCPSDAIDVAVLDLDALHGAGIEIALAVREHRPRSWPWIALGHSDDPVQRAAFRIGRAAPLLLDLNTPEALATAVADALSAICRSATVHAAAVVQPTDVLAARR